jgi:hypothetical protein
MIRKALIIGILGLGIALAGFDPSLCHRIAAAAKNFQQSFRDLKVAGDSLSPLERLVFSLVLAGTHTPQGGSAANGD